MASGLISVDLPDNKGKVTPFYTYDGYLEENDRARIRSERNNLSSFCITGASILGWVGFIVK